MLCMCKLIKNFFKKRAQEKLKCEELCSTYLSRIDYLLESEQALFSDITQNVECEADAQWTAYTTALIEEAGTNIFPQVRRAKAYKQLKLQYEVLLERTQKHASRVQAHNQLVLEGNICKAMIPQFDAFKAQCEQHFLRSTSFIPASKSDAWLGKLSDFQSQLNGFTSKRILKIPYYNILRDNIRRLQNATAKSDQSA